MLTYLIYFLPVFFPSSSNVFMSLSSFFLKPFSASTFSFLSRGIILCIELPWPENPANTYARHTETLDSSFDLIRSHQQCIPWPPPLVIEPATTDCSADVNLYPCTWGDNNYAYFKSSWEDVALEETVSSIKSTDVTCKNTFRLISRAITMSS